MKSDSLGFISWSIRDLELVCSVIPNIYHLSRAGDNKLFAQTNIKTRDLRRMEGCACILELELINVTRVKVDVIDVENLLGVGHNV